jgi:hypothetical protein
MVIEHRVGAAEYGGDEACQHQRRLVEADVAMLADGDAAFHEEPDTEQAKGDDFQFIPAAALLPRTWKEGVGNGKHERPHEMQDHAGHLGPVLHRQV